MNVLLIVIPISLVLGLGFLVAFIWSVDHDQYIGLDEKAKLPVDE